MCLSPAALATGGFSVSYITDTDPDTLSYESDGTTNLLDYVNMGSTANNGTYYLLKTGDTSTRSIRALTFNGDTKLYLAASLSIEKSLTFNGNALVILGDGVTLTVGDVLSCTGNLTITTAVDATNAKLIVNGGTGTDGDSKVNGYGIYSGKSLSIYAGTVNATGGNVTEDYTNSYGIYVFYNSLTISGSGTSVTATGGTASGSYGESRGILCKSSNITGGTVNATGNEATYYSYGIEDAGTLSIGGSAQVTAKSNKATGSCGIKCTDMMSISGSAEVIAEGDKINKADGSDGIRCSTVTVDGSAKVTATGGIASQSSCGIRCKTVTIGGNAKVTATGGTSDRNYSIGIYANDGSGASVNITGGTVEAIGDTGRESYGIRSEGVSNSNGNVIISGGTVTAISGTASAANGNSYGIFATGSSDGKISISQPEGKTTKLYGKDNGPVSLSAYTLSYDGGELKLATDSTFTYSLSSSDSNMSFLPLLPKGYAFAMRGETGEAETVPKPFIAGSGKIVLKECDHMSGENSVRENGKCKFCGAGCDGQHDYVTSWGGCSSGCTDNDVCQHGSIDASGKCTICQTQFRAKLTAGSDTFWAMNVSALMEKRAENAANTVTLYANLKSMPDLTTTGTAWTLDLNGYDYSGDIYVGNSTTEGNLTVSNSSTGGWQSRIFGIRLVKGTAKLNAGVYLGWASVENASDLGALLPAGAAFEERGSSGTYALFDTTGVTRYTVDMRVVSHTSHTYDSTTGKCPCGAVAAVCVTGGGVTTGYESFADAYTAAKSGDTIKLFSNVSDAMTINNSSKKITLDLNGNSVSALTVSVPATITDSAGGGTITALTTDGNVKIGGLLAEGYGFKSGSTWYDSSSEETRVSNVSVQKLPFKGLTVEAGNDVTGTQTAGFRWDYGKNASFSLCATDNISTETSHEAVKLSGTYVLKQGETVKEQGGIAVATPGASWIAKASHFDGTEDLAQAAPLQISGTLLPAGSYTLEITVTAVDHDYSRTISIPVTVNKGTVTTNDPTANTGLTYNAQERELVIKPVTLPSGTTVQYRLPQSDSWSNTIPKAKNAGTYTVYWQVDGGDNYNDLTDTTPVTVTIDPNDIRKDKQTAIVYFTVPDLTYNGQPQTPSPALKLRSRGDNNSTVEEYETLVKDRDYTVTVEPQTNAGDYQLTLTGKGNYTGEMSHSWVINKASAPTLRDIPVSQKYTVTGEQSKQLGNLMPDDAGTLSYSEGTPTMPDTAAVTGFTVSETGFMKYTLSGIVGNVITLPVTIHSTNYADATVNVVVTLTEKDTQAALTITSPNTATYRTMLQLMESGGSGSGRVSWSVVDGTGSAVINNGSILYPTKAGTVIVTATKAGDNSYNEISSEPMTITIAPLQISGEPLYTPITTGGKTLKDAALRRNDSWYKFSSLFGWVDKDGNPLPDSTEVQQNTAYTWRLLLDESEAGNCTPMLLSGEIVLWSKSAPPASNGKHHITVDDAENGSVSVEPSGAKAGETVTVTVKPDAGYAVEDITITDRNGNKVKLTRKGDKYTFEMPESGVTVKVKFAKSGNPFVDVPEGKYFYDAVLWAVENGITGGVDATHFDPYASCTRGQLVTFLWRAAGCPAAKDSKGFADVAAGRYCEAAVAWAAENGIVGGYDDGSFRPDATVTRQQTAAILWRFAKYAGMDVTVGEDTNILSFNDAFAISDYAVPAIQWAVSAEVMGGSNGSLLPGNVCNRAQIVTMLYRSIAK